MHVCVRAIVLLVVIFISYYILYYYYILANLFLFAFIGLRVAIHAIGDRANSVVLGNYKLFNYFNLFYITSVLKKN